MAAATAGGTGGGASSRPRAWPRPRAGGGWWGAFSPCGVHPETPPNHTFWGGPGVWVGGPGGGGEERKKGGGGGPNPPPHDPNGRGSSRGDQVLPAGGGTHRRGAHGRADA